MEGEDVPFESISIWLPLPYRVLLLGLIGIWLFAFNLHYFDLVRIDVAPFLRYTRTASEAPLHTSVYHVAATLSGIYFSNLILFWMLTSGDPAALEHYQFLPMVLYLLILIIFLWPLGSWHKRGRQRFTRMLRRILTGGLDSDLRFADILLADALTSYAKVLGDAAIVFCMYFSDGSATHPIPNRSCGGAYLVPCVIAIPYFCRLRQCLIEYLRASDKGLESRVHLLNAAKYASAFPVIVLGAMERHMPLDDDDLITKEGLSRSWYLAVLVNTCFSFYWDVTRDWELSLFTKGRVGEHPWGLRKNRHFEAKELYYIAIGIDLVLRCAWSVKLSPHLDFLNEMEGGIFVLELLEVCRRWVWVFFRVEKEYVAAGDPVTGYVGLRDAEDGIMMSEFLD